MSKQFTSAAKDLYFSWKEKRNECEHCGRYEMATPDWARRAVVRASKTVEGVVIDAPDLERARSEVLAEGLL
jgi:hypothetical protein